MWAEKIIAVRSGKLTATEAAQQLSVSRKTYYEKENRALAAIMEALRDQPGGRPPQKTDEGQEDLQRKVKTLEEENLLLRSTLRIRDVMQPAEAEGGKKGMDPQGHA